MSDIDANITPAEEWMVIGKDKDFNDVCMTPEEAEEYVMAGNFLRLYEGSEFDIDGDGIPERIHYEYTDAPERVDMFMVEFYYDTVTIGDLGTLEGMFEGVLEEVEGAEGIIIVSLDGKSKQLLVSNTYYHPWDYTYDGYDLYIIENGEIVYNSCVDDGFPQTEFDAERCFKSYTVMAWCIFTGLEREDTVRYEDNRFVRLSSYIDVSQIESEVVQAVEYLYLTDAENEELEFVSTAGEKFEVVEIEYLYDGDDIPTDLSAKGELKIYLRRISDGRIGWGIYDFRDFRDKQGSTCIEEYIDCWFEGNPTIYG